MVSFKYIVYTHSSGSKRHNIVRNSDETWPCTESCGKHSPVRHYSAALCDCCQASSSHSSWEVQESKINNFGASLQSNQSRCREQQPVNKSRRNVIMRSSISVPRPTISPSVSLAFWSSLGTVWDLSQCQAGSSCNSPS